MTPSELDLDEPRVASVDVRVVAPPPGRAMLACRCGTPLSEGTMHRRTRPRAESGAAVRIEEIVCGPCAMRQPW